MTFSLELNYNGDSFIQLWIAQKNAFESFNGFVNFGWSLKALSIVLYALSSFIHTFSPSFYHLLVIIILHVHVHVLVSYFHVEKLGSLSGVEPEGGWIQICGVPWAVEEVWGVMGGD